MRNRGPDDYDDKAMDVLLGDLKEYLAGKQRERFGASRKPEAELPGVDDGASAASDAADGPEAMPEECRTGKCEHPEHWDDGDDLLDDL